MMAPLYDGQKLVRLLTYVTGLVNQACFTDVSPGAYSLAPQYRNARQRRAWSRDISPREESNDPYGMDSPSLLH